jgi:chloride channel protein, CIC family
LTEQLSTAWLLTPLFVCKLVATGVSLGSGSSGGIFSPPLFLGATLGAAFAGFLSLAAPGVPVNLPAVAMIFEMTRDYAIVMPMILAVAVALGVRRMLSRENIYTPKLAARTHDPESAASEHVSCSQGEGSHGAGFSEGSRRNGARRVLAPGRSATGCGMSW